jgi:HK97 family phage major capsid protein
MLNTAPVTTADFTSPERNASAYQIGAQSDLTPGGVAILPDSLVDLVYSVRSAYRANGTFVMNSLTAGAIRKLKDADNQYLWAQGLVAGQPDRLLGYPVQVWEDLPDIGAGNFPVLFGDFMRGYQLVDRTDLRITRDQVTTPGFVRYYVRRRLGGAVWDNHSVKALQVL